MSRVTPPPGLTLLYDRAQIQKRVDELASSIRRDYAQRNRQDMVVVCVLKGAIVFLADLVREIGLDFRLSCQCLQLWLTDRIDRGADHLRRIRTRHCRGRCSHR